MKAHRTLNLWQEQQITNYAYFQWIVSLRNMIFSLILQNIELMEDAQIAISLLKFKLIEILISRDRI